MRIQLPICGRRRFSGGACIVRLWCGICGDVLGPRLAPAALGFMTLFFGIGQALGPNVAGAIADKEESYSIMGACFEVYKDKGCGFLEAVYQECPLSLLPHFFVVFVVFVVQKFVS